MSTTSNICKKTNNVLYIVLLLSGVATSTVEGSYTRYTPIHLCTIVHVATCTSLDIRVVDSLLYCCIICDSIL